MNCYEELSSKIENKNAVVGIIGVGYVGSDLALGSRTSGFKTIGFTRRKTREEEINQKGLENFTATVDVAQLSECNIICICVPTPIHKDKTPDLEPLETSLRNVAKYFKKGTLVIIESTIAPGTTRNFSLPILKGSGLVEGKDFFLSFSPERVDPGNKTFNIFNTPKVISGLDEHSLKLAVDFYNCFIEKTVPVSSLEVAEMSKILENTFRLVNISLSNELLSYANNIGIDLWEVISAAASKPFGFLPHYPGPGIGGHCIPVDPYYLLDDARKRGVDLAIIERAGEVNDNQPRKVVKKTIDIINKTNGKKKKHSAMIVGLSYKENTDDRRESPSLKIWELLKEEDIEVSYHDPYIPQYKDLFSQEISNLTLKDKDIVIITTPHANIDYETLLSSNVPILDTKNVLKENILENVYKL